MILLPSRPSAMAHALCLPRRNRSYVLPNSRWSQGSQIGATALSNYVKCPKAQRIAGPNSLDHLRGFCNSPHMLCIVQLLAFRPFRRAISPAVRATLYSFCSLPLRKNWPTAPGARGLPSRPLAVDVVPVTRSTLAWLSPCRCTWRWSVSRSVARPRGDAVMPRLSAP